MRIKESDLFKNLLTGKLSQPEQYKVFFTEEKLLGTQLIFSSQKN